MQILKDLHQQQSEAVKTLDWQGQRRELRQLSDLGALALKTMGRVNKALEGVWNYVFSPAVGNLSPILSQGIFPWLVPLCSDTVKASIAPLVEKLGRRPEGHRQIIRAKRILQR